MILAEEDPLHQDHLVGHAKTSCSDQATKFTQRTVEQSMCRIFAEAMQKLKSGGLNDRRTNHT